MRNILKSLSTENNGLAQRLSEALDFEEILVAPYGLTVMVISKTKAYDLRFYGAAGEIYNSLGWASAELCWLYAISVINAVNLDLGRIIIDNSVEPDSVENLVSRSKDEVKIVWESECDYAGLMIGEVQGFKPHW
jgi:hypothetical protein